LVILAVFVDARQEMHLIAHLPPETRNGVRQDFFIGVAQVRRTIHIVDGGRDVEGLHVESDNKTPRPRNVESFDAPSPRGHCPIAIV
jgi:hypothetical protein